MFTLIALGTGAAYVYSLAAVLAPGLFPAAFRSGDGSVPLYFEAAAVITVLVLLGQVLELRARDRTGDALRALLDLAPRTARRVTDKGDEEVPPALSARATASASVPASAFPSTAASRKAAAPSTNPWSPAKASPSRRRQVPASSAAR